MKTHLILIALLGFTSLRAADPLPSWDENAPEKATSPSSRR
jgi:hypothetical protein